jgi:hypothetical protein
MYASHPERVSKHTAAFLWCFSEVHSLPLERLRSLLSRCMVVAERVWPRMLLLMLHKHSAANRRLADAWLDEAVNRIHLTEPRIFKLLHIVRNMKLDPLHDVPCTDNIMASMMKNARHLSPTLRAFMTDVVTALIKLAFLQGTRE